MQGSPLQRSLSDGPYTGAVHLAIMAMMYVTGA